ncbi:MAG: suppressor of fused domain protein [Leptospirales bacterium]|nr:suppressor of fused domain protein [Leptospirales bacterium]
MSTTPTLRNKQVAKWLSAVFDGKGKPQVHLFGDEKKESSVFILTCQDTPQKGVNTYATVSLSDTILTHDGKELGLRGEIIAVCSAKTKGMDNAVASAAFYVMNSGYELFPGAIFPEALVVSGTSKHLKHFLFAVPFLWDKIEPLYVESVRVAPLLAVPISDNEMAFAVEKGPQELERLLESSQVDIYDISRPCAVTK